jgi:hypothetical protein
VKKRILIFASVILAAVVGYIGESKPQAEADFQVLGAANQVSGWKVYSLSNEIVTSNTGEVYVALGISVNVKPN